MKWKAEKQERKINEIKSRSLEKSETGKFPARLITKKEG